METTDYTLAATHQAQRREREGYVRSAEESVRWHEESIRSCQERLAREEEALTQAQAHLAWCRQWLAGLDSEEAS